MLADPQSITIAGTAVSLPRTAVNGTSADYTSADGAVSLRVQQQTSKGTRRTSVSLRNNKIAADPLMAVNRRVSDVVSLNINAPLDGFTATELRDHVLALCAALSASSGSMVTKVLGGEK